MKTTSNITIKKYQSELFSTWQEFLKNANNGSIFHDLNFLAYHEQGTHDEHHLMFYDDDKLIALLPAAIVHRKENDRCLLSPYGASIGGFVLDKHIKLYQLIDIVSHLCQYAKANQLSSIEMRLGPPGYMLQPNQLLEFTLMKAGFRLNARWLSFVITIETDYFNKIDTLFNSTKRYEVRANLKKGVYPREVDSSKLDVFYEMLVETLQRHESKPTHTKQELAKLFVLVPERIRLFLCEYNWEEIAGTLVFILNNKMAYTFYFCEKEAHKKLCGPTLLVHHVLEKLKQEGITCLDLGPSASTHHFNKGVVNFKEGLGAKGACRDEWIWSASHDATCLEEKIDD